MMSTGPTKLANDDTQFPVRMPCLSSSTAPEVVPYRQILDPSATSKFISHMTRMMCPPDMLTVHALSCFFFRFETGHNLHKTPKLVRAVICQFFHTIISLFRTL